MTAEVDTAMRHLLAALVILTGFVAWRECHSATFASANIDFLGRGRSCGLVARPRDVDNLLSNPSALGRYREEKSSVFAAFMDYIGGLKGGAVGYGARGGARWGYGTFLTYLTSGSIPLATWDDPVGGSGGDFSYTELGGGLSCGVEASPYLWLGGSVKVIREALDDDASTAAACDLGGTVRVHGSEENGGHVVYACILARNIVRSAWNTESDGPAPRLESGLALDLAGGRFSTGCSLSSGNHGRHQLSVGLSGLMSDEFGARIGYKRRVGTASDASYDLPRERGLVAGFSLLLGRFWMDYTYEDASPLDNIHRIGLRVLPDRSVQAR